MSTVNLSDLMRELQAGEEARQRVPALQAQADDLTHKLDDAQRHAQELETSIIDYKRTIDGLNAKVRSLEVERDDAGFRELETADKLNTVLNALRGFRHDIDEAVQHVDPPKPEQPAPTPVQDAGVPVESKPAQNIPIIDHGDQSATRPTSALTNQPPTSATSSATQEQAATSGESASHPTAQSTEPTPAHASGAGAGPSDAAASSNNPQAYRPFEGQSSGAVERSASYPEGKRWYDKPNHMSTSEWVASGGEA